MIAGALLTLASTPYAGEPAIVAHTVAGAPLTPTELSEASRTRLEGNLTRARAEFEREPSEMATIWLGRRLAYLQRYPKRSRSTTMACALSRFLSPAASQGHRHVSRREFDLAIDAFSRPGH